MSTSVCLMGQTPARELFPDESPIGKEVRVQGVILKVVGVLERKGANMMGADQDDVVIAPWTTVKFRINGAKLAFSDLNAALNPVASASQVNTLSNQYLTPRAALSCSALRLRRPTSLNPCDSSTSTTSICRSAPEKKSRRPSMRSLNCCVGGTRCARDSRMISRSATGLKSRTS